MSLPTLSGVGRLTDDVTLRWTASGKAVATIPLAFNSRKRDPQTSEWVDGDVFFVRGTAFNALAEHAMDSLRKGDEVVVSGRVKTERWQDKQTGENRSATSLLVDSIGPSLAWATAAPQKVERSGGQYSDGSRVRPTGPVVAANGVDDPWGTTPTDDSQAPF